jgi:hypothetical protein
MLLSHVQLYTYYNYASFLGSCPQDLLIHPSKIFN